MAELALEDNYSLFGDRTDRGDGSNSDASGSIEPFRRRSISRGTNPAYNAFNAGIRSGSFGNVSAGGFSSPKRSQSVSAGNLLHLTHSNSSNSHFENVAGAGGAVAASFGGHPLSRWNLPSGDSANAYPGASKTPTETSNSANNNINAAGAVESLGLVPGSFDERPSRNPLNRNTSYLSTILKGKNATGPTDSSNLTPTDNLNPINTADFQDYNEEAIVTSPVSTTNSTSYGTPSPFTYSTPARTFRVKQQKNTKSASTAPTTTTTTPSLAISGSPHLNTNIDTLTSLPSFPSPTSITPASQTSPLLFSQGSTQKNNPVLAPHLEYQTFNENGETLPDTTPFFQSAAFKPSSWGKWFGTWAQDNLTKESIIENGVKRPLGYLPSVILGALLNILDGLSYGMILFPLNNPIFAALGPAGLSMFYVSCVISQLVYSLGASNFGSAVGSEMIEVVPFFHTMAMTLVQEIGEDKPHTVIATTITAFALSSIVTGFVFFMLGYARLGSIIGFFPRHILVGCIGGVGWFLVVTGLEVSSRLDGSFQYDWETLKWFMVPGTLIKWGIPLALAFILVFAQKFTHHPLLVPSYFITVFAVFHLSVLIVPSLTYERLRETGWLFQGPEDSGEPWWYFYTLYDFRAVDYVALLKTIPAMFALTFFGILHVPINVPALAASIGEDNIDVDRELLAHGISNALSGFCGSIQNYLVYTNSVLFIRSGADSRLSGVMLAIATFCIMIAGPVVIGFIPVMVVGALIFLLGIELINEALIDTWGRVSKFEYITILTIVVTMGAWDFVAGIIVGILLACASFTIQASQTSAIKATFTGSVARSTVRRNAALQSFLFEVGDQIFVLKLTGNIFFGTIVRIEEAVRSLLDDVYFYQQPIRYLILDMAAVTGLDFSAAEAFARMKRLLDTKSVYMIISSPDEAHMIEALHAVGLLERAYSDQVLNQHGSRKNRHHTDEEASISSTSSSARGGGIDDDESSTRVRLFPSLNSSLEWCENQFLKDYYIRRDILSSRHPARPSSSGSGLSSVLGKKGIEIPEASAHTTSNTKVDALIAAAGESNAPAASGGNLLDVPVSRSDSIKALDGPIVGSPRVAFLQLVADKTAREDPQVLASTSKWQHYKQPLPLLLQTFQGVTTKRESFWHRVSPYFEREEIPAGTVMYQSDTEASSFYIVESGVLRADYDTIEQGTLYEIILAGTTCGELPFFSGTYRTATVTAESDAVVWKLDRKSWQALKELKPDGPDIANEFYLISLKLTVERFESVTGYTLISSR